jgi:hypothetical protein
VPSVMKLLRELMQWSFEFVVVTDEDRSNACFFPPARLCYELKHWCVDNAGPPWRQTWITTI